jgi:cell division septation protein DedD
MNRIITILVTIFILLLLYIWISHVWGSDKPRHPRQIVDAKETQLSDEYTADADTSLYNSTPTQETTDEPLTNDEFATERPVDETEEPEPEPVKSEPVVEKKAPEPKKAEPKPEPKKVSTPTTPVTKPAATPAKTESKPAAAKPAATTPATGGLHLVIAGNFAQKVNAEQRVQELKKAGFNDAEVINFDLSEYHTVCVGRFSDVNEARKLVKKLKDYHKIDAYVRIGG